MISREVREGAKVRKDSVLTRRIIYHKSYGQISTTKVGRRYAQIYTAPSRIFASSRPSREILQTSLGILYGNIAWITGLTSRSSEILSCTAITGSPHIRADNAVRA